MEALSNIKRNKPVECREEPRHSDVGPLLNIVCRTRKTKLS